MTTKTSFHINGFWFHVNWNTPGTIGIDQHGQVWLNRKHPRSECGGLQVTLTTVKPVTSNKDYFGQQRESYYEYFHSRSALIRK